MAGMTKSGIWAKELSLSIVETYGQRGVSQNTYGKYCITLNFRQIKRSTVDF